MRVILEPHELKYIHKVLDEYGDDIIIIIKDVNVDESTNLEAIQEKEIEVKKETLCSKCYNPDCEIPTITPKLYDKVNNCIGFKPKPIEVKKSVS